MCLYNYNLMLKFSVPDGFLLRQITAVGFLIPKAATFNIFARSTLFLFNQFPVYLSAGQLAVLLRQQRVPQDTVNAGYTQLAGAGEAATAGKAAADLADTPTMLEATGMFFQSD